MKIQYVFSIFSLFCVNISFADCRSDAQRALQSGNNHLVITFEGLMSAAYTHTYKLAKAANEATGSKAKIYSYSHAGGPTVSAACIRQWKAVHGNKLRLTVAGHSFGGNAALRLSDDLQKDGITISDLVLLDARKGDESIMCRTLGKTYEKPVNVVHATAIYQSGCLAGRSLASSESTKNIHVATGHIGVPYSPEARDVMEKILGGSELSEDTAIAAVPVASNNAESDEDSPVQPLYVRPASINKNYKCELRATPGVYVDCTKEQLDKQESRRTQEQSR